jgi:hypothetical protein
MIIGVTHFPKRNSGKHLDASGINAQSWFHCGANDCSAGVLLARTSSYSPLAMDDKKFIFFQFKPFGDGHHSSQRQALACFNGLGGKPPDPWPFGKVSSQALDTDFMLFTNTSTLEWYQYTEVVAEIFKALTFGCRLLAGKEVLKAFASGASINGGYRCKRLWASDVRFEQR